MRAVVECHFCHEQYIYDQAAPSDCVARRDWPPESGRLHSPQVPGGLANSCQAVFGPWAWIRPSCWPGLVADRARRAHNEHVAEPVAQHLIGGAAIDPAWRSRCAHGWPWLPEVLWRAT